MEKMNVYDMTIIFIHDVLKAIVSEKEIPGINFVFDDKTISFIKNVKDNYDGRYWYNITDEDIESLNKYNDSFCYIKINDAYRFFSLLADISNNQTLLEKDYGYNTNPFSKANLICRRIWLRCNPKDFEHIEDFLEKQKDFIEDRSLDNPKEKIYLSNNISYSIDINNTFCETSRNAKISISDHDLPSVLYDIRDEFGEKVCYIYGVQNEKHRNVNKKIERSLYKINNGVNSLVHPNFSNSMVIFYDLLKEKGISKIKVPLLEVLSYDYHILLSKYTKDYYSKRWNKIELENMELIKSYDMNTYNKMLNEYEDDSIWYRNSVDKEDLISKNKTENLYNLFLLLDNLGYSHINGIDIDDELNIELDKKLSLKR